MYVKEYASQGPLMGGYPWPWSRIHIKYPLYVTCLPVMISIWLLQQVSWTIDDCDVDISVVISVIVIEEVSVEDTTFCDVDSGVVEEDVPDAVEDCFDDEVAVGAAEICNRPLCIIYTFIYVHICMIYVFYNNLFYLNKKYTPELKSSLMGIFSLALYLFNILVLQMIILYHYYC